MEMEEFEDVIGKAVDGIPEKFRVILEDNGISVLARERVPAPARRQFRNSVLFGMFIGVPFGEPAGFQGEPTRIELYKESFEEMFGGDAGLVEKEIARTVVHEIAHYFGFSEKEIRRLGY